MNVKEIAIMTMIVTETYFVGREKIVSQSPQVVPGRLTLRTTIIGGIRHSQSRWSTKETILVTWVDVRVTATMTLIAEEE